MKTILFGLLAVMVFAIPVFAQTQSQAQMDQDIALMKKDIQADKATLITANMEFTADEAAAFWPVYKVYEDSLSKVGDKRIALIKDYAQNYGSMTNEKATELIQGLFDTEAQRLQLKKDLFQNLLKVMPAKNAARMIQVENRLNMLIDLQLVSGIPLVSK